MAGRENEETAVSVRDFGVGIAKEHLPRFAYSSDFIAPIKHVAGNLEAQDSL